MVMEFARQVTPFLLLGLHDLLGQQPHLGFGTLRSVLEEAQTQNDDQCDDQAEQHRLPSEPVEIAAERGMALRDFRALFRQIRIVQLFDLLSNRQHRVAPRHHVAAKESGTFDDLLSRSPVEQRVECLPVILELRLKAGNLVVPIHQLPEFGEGRHVRLPEGGELLPILRRFLSRDIEQVVADEDAGQIDIGSERAQLDLDVAVMCVELVELDVNLLRLA